MTVSVAQLMADIKAKDPTAFDTNRKADGKDERKTTGKVNGSTYTDYIRLNTAALKDIAAWAPKIFPEGRWSSESWRVSSQNLGRDLEEDFSIHPDGVRDFGDEVGLTPVSAVVKFGRAKDEYEAALKLCELLGIDPKEVGVRAPKTTTPKRSIVLTHWSQMAALGRRPYLVKGLLSTGAMSVIFGAPGSMKTFVALDLALHVARGESWAGMRVKQAAVVYVACEGGLSIEDRLAAFALHHEVKRADVPFYVLPETVNLRESDVDVDALIEAVTALPNVGLIVVDTLSRALAGGNENGPEDMGAFVSHIDKLRQATGAHVLIIHHSGKDADRGLRGHSLLKAAVDTEIQVERTEDLCTISVQKQRDMAMDVKRGFEWAILEIARDEDGDPVTSLVLRATDREPDPNAGLPKQKRGALDVLWKAIKSGEGEAKEDLGLPSGWRAIPENRWRQLCKELPLTKGSADAAKKAFDRAKKALDAAGEIDSSQGWVWPTWEGKSEPM